MSRMVTLALPRTSSTNIEVGRSKLEEKVDEIWA